MTIMADRSAGRTGALAGFADHALAVVLRVGTVGVSAASDSDDGGQPDGCGQGDGEREQEGGSESGEAWSGAVGRVG